MGIERCTLNIPPGLVVFNQTVDFTLARMPTTLTPTLTLQILLLQNTNSNCKNATDKNASVLNLHSVVKRCSNQQSVITTEDTAANMARVTMERRQQMPREVP